MKRNFIKATLKPVAAMVLLSVMISSCSVEYRQRHRRPPPPPVQEKVIIKP